MHTNGMYGPIDKRNENEWHPECFKGTFFHLGRQRDFGRMWTQ